MLMDFPRHALLRPLTRNEVVGMLVRLTIFGAATYYSIRWVVEALDPTQRQKSNAKKRAEQMMRRIGVEGVSLNEYEMNIAAHLVDPHSMKVTWSDVAGFDDIITELQDSVLLPFQKRHLFRGSKLLQPPKGVLLYGPPGCGKTLIAKAAARASGCQFINLQVSTLTDKWYGESEKLTAAVFSLAAKLQPCIIFIDEIDSFLRSRSSLDHEATAIMKAQFMSLWDGLETGPDTQVMVMGATNRPQDVDAAIRRRMPATFHVGLPNAAQRKEILHLILSGENLSEAVNLMEIAEQTEGFSGSDLREVCRDAALYRVRDFVRKQQMKQITQQLRLEQDEEETVDSVCLRPITQLDLLFGLDKMNESKQATGPAHISAVFVD
ncbi:outer mitochondrial transmembrane helix translocase [Ictalurus furcatus]|uniref:outer mitochondrial transmembrane helix translocase n=1 Tax=Ictalurus furcatus TaxID=66913 RepID=UPI00234FE4CC|nr:outer mitochondrial transmembrane helix translocase [Ictalurus furcatus]XP_053466551.1 outer mitochondrial transmembrane helix translocase [Ictalurus furcatus]XP_053466552.1 outer mitochondrial transmembrane helix translocase [Ictalurus furcatus]XP_053466553.1 outer mitochondrial transmembrane helix translocase [Ictalurus furcatus]